MKTCALVFTVMLATTACGSADGRACAKFVTFIQDAEIGIVVTREETRGRLIAIYDDARAASSAIKAAAGQMLKAAADSDRCSLADG